MLISLGMILCAGRTVGSVEDEAGLPRSIQCTRLVSPATKKSLLQVEEEVRAKEASGYRHKRSARIDGHWVLVLGTNIVKVAKLETVLL